MKTTVWVPRLVAVLLSATAIHAQQVQQSVSLTPGWNTIYMSVSPQISATEFFADWPVNSVSAYSASAMLETSQSTDDATGEGIARNPFTIWTREAPASSTMLRVAADTVLVCFSTNSTIFSKLVTGIPRAPHIAWHKTDLSGSTLNYVGVCLDGVEHVPANDYLAGADIGSYQCYKLAGKKESTPYVSQFFGLPSFTNGQALLVSSEKISDWSGPLLVTPANGIALGTNSTVGTVAIRNAAATNKTVHIQYLGSAASDLAFKPDLLFRDVNAVVSNAAWQAWDQTLTKSLAAGETWLVQVALDRTQLHNTRNLIGGIFKITEEGASHMLVRIPVTAVDVTPLGTQWPSGLWVMQVELDKVSRYINDATRTDGLPAGGQMKLRLLMHVDVDGNPRLLQRVVINGHKHANGAIIESLYAGSAAPPTDGVASTRLSCVALPVEVPVIEPLSGVFQGCNAIDKLVFTYRVGAGSPSNPLRHRLHPQFDGLRSDFQTPAPDGDDVTNYAGSVKPELFGFDGMIALTWDASPGTAWDPDETLTGTCRWGYDGLRREGPVYADGTFSMMRIVKVGTLHLE